LGLQIFQKCSSGYSRVNPAQGLNRNNTDA